jgi:hypothetical protein
MEHISENEEDNDNLSVDSILINNDQLNSQKDSLLQELELIKRNIAENNRVRFYMENELNEITRARDEKLRENEELMSHNESIVQNIWRNQEDLLRIQNEKQNSVSTSVSETPLSAASKPLSRPSARKLTRSSSFNNSRISSETNERLRNANAVAAQFVGEDDQVSNDSSYVDPSGNPVVDVSGNQVDASGNPITSQSAIQKINDETISYRKYTYQEIEERIQKNYFEDNQKYSSALDIVATYLKGQKLIYMESKTYCENKLYKLMLPSIFLSAVATVIATIMNDYVWGPYLIASLNGIISFLLAVVNYLKLDATAEAHKSSSHQYDKLQTSMEFLSGTTLLFYKDRETIQKKLDDVEKKIGEIKEANQFIVPKDIRTMYPITYNTNVFLIIKKIEDIKKRKINNITDLKNQKNYLVAVSKMKKNKNKNTSLKNVEKEIDKLNEYCRNEINNLLDLKSAYSIIDEMFAKEMENAELKKKLRCRAIFCCGFGMNEKIINPKEISTFVEDVMDPYGRRDKKVEEEEKKKKELENKQEREKKELENKIIKEDEKFKKVWAEIKKTKTLLKDNIELTEEIYNKMEKGQLENIDKKHDDDILTLKKFPMFVKLLGLEKKELDINGIKLMIDEIQDNESDKGDKASVNNSDSEHEFMDLEVQGVCINANNNNALVVKGVGIETSTALVVKNN